MCVTDMSDSSLLEEAFSRLFVREIVNDTLPSAEDYDVSVIKDLRSASDHCLYTKQMDNDDDDDTCFEDDNNNSIHESCSESVVDGNLRRPSSSRGSPDPKRRKSVTFADSQGGDLVEVREFDNTIEPLQNGLSNSPHRYHSFKDDGATAAKFTLLFPQPCANYSSFTRRLSTQKVSLENAQIIYADVLIGTIKVQNLDYDKSVTLRYSMDGWRTLCDLEAKFLHSDSPDVDVFTFKVKIGPEVSTVQFCVRFRCKSQEFWDNNDGNNYSVVAR